MSFGLASWAWWLVLGLLIGLLIEWVVDWLYWRRKIASNEEALVVVRSERDKSLAAARATEAELGTLRGSYNTVLATRDRLQVDLEECRAFGARLSTERDGLHAELGSVRGEFDGLQHSYAGILAERDDLQAGLVGLRTSNLSLSAERDGLQAELDNLRSANSQLLVERDELKGHLDSLQVDAAGLRNAYAGLTAERDSLQAELEALRATGTLSAADTSISFGAGPSLDADLRADTGRDTVGASAQQLDSRLGGLRSRLVGLLGLGATLHAETGAADEASPAALNAPDLDQRLEFELTNLQTRLVATTDDNQRLRGELENLRLHVANLQPVQPDRLDEIDGIGTVYQERLNRLGIFSFGQLAQQSPEHLRAMLGVESWQDINLENWIIQARYRLPVKADRLIDIDGIGPVYEKRLNEAGIYTFAQLVQTSPEQLRDLVNAQEWQDVDTLDWIRQAYALMGESAKEQGS